MSKVGKVPIHIPSGCNISFSESVVNVSGPKGKLEIDFHKRIELKKEEDKLFVSKAGEESSNSYWGLYRSLIASMLEGVSKGFEKTLELRGVGYRGSVSGNILALSLGYSHEIFYSCPSEVEVKCSSPTVITISGCDKQKVSQVAAEIRALRKPEPYKGSGVRYKGEYVRSKEGKKK